MPQKLVGFADNANSSALVPRSFRGPFMDSDGYPLEVSWPYDRTESLADGVIHVIGLALALLAAIGLIIFAYKVIRRVRGRLGRHLCLLSHDVRVLGRL
jgi:hypothetical protein